MKKAYTIIALMGLLIAMAVAANAQITSQLRANVPFEFNVGNQTLPAGEYRIARVNPSSDQVVLQINAKDGRHNAMVPMSWVKGKAATGSMLVFHRYADRYFLAQAWIDGQSEGLAASKSQAERATQKKLAAIKSQTETVMLRAR